MAGAGPDLVLDLDFEGLMNESEMKHLFQQVRLAGGRGLGRKGGSKSKGVIGIDFPLRTVHLLM